MWKFLRNLILLIIVGIGIVLAIGWYNNARAAEMPQVICGGPDGTYCKRFAPKVLDVLYTERFNDYQIANSAGSVEACNRVLTNPLNVAIAQLDVVNICGSANPGKITVIRKLADECLFAVTNDPNLTWSRIERIANRLKIVTAARLSGTVATLNAIANLETDSRLALAMKDLNYQDNADAAVKLVAESNAYDLAFFVAYADITSNVFKTANAADLTFVGVATPLMKDITFDGEAVYSLKEVEVRQGGFGGLLGGTTIKTACTSATIITGDPSQFEEGSIEREDQEDLISALMAAPTADFLPTDSAWQKIVGSVREVADQAWDLTQ